MSNPSVIATPSSLIKHGTLPAGPDADVFTGAEHGPVPVSLFMVHSSPGAGPRLHRHRYPEVFVIHDGRALFRLGESEVTADAGDIVIAPAGVAHRFTATGESELRLTAIHSAPEIETEWLAEG